MPVIPKLVQRNSPGVYLNEDTYGAVPAVLKDHGNVYVLGTCTSSTFPYNVPVYIANYTDFISQCISSPSAAAVELFFNQRSGSGLYFVRVAPRQQSSLTATTFSAGTVLSVTAGAATVTYTCLATETAATATAALGAKINRELAGVISFYSDLSGSYLRYPVGTTPTVSPSLTLGAAATATTPRAYDVADAINFSFVPENGQGYLCAPEFFQSFTAQAERTALQLAMEAFVSDPRFYWVAVVDFGQATATATYLVNAAQSERATFVSPRGNSWAVFPYVKNTVGALVPASLAMVGVALRRARAEGFAQPPASANYPVYGVSGLSANITTNIQDQLNPRGINCLRELPARGVVVYGARTLSPSSYYTFAATRVILNVLAGSLRTSFDSIVFSLVDGQGVLFSRIRQTAANVCEILRQAGALYGATPDQAYLVICDSTNNPPDQLDAGTVGLDVVVKPSPTLEVLNITLSRSSLNTVLVEVAASGDPSAIQA